MRAISRYLFSSSFPASRTRCSKSGTAENGRISGRYLLLNRSLRHFSSSSPWSFRSSAVRKVGMSLSPLVEKALSDDPVPAVRLRFAVAHGTLAHLQAVDNPPFDHVRQDAGCLSVTGLDSARLKTCGKGSGGRRRRSATGSPSRRATSVQGPAAPPGAKFKNYRTAKSYPPKERWHRGEGPQ
jgi:hypothetical protein